MLDPCHEEIDDALLAFGGDGDAARHLPPLREATAATAGAGVLGDEHGMTAHRRLLAVVGRIRRGEACADEVLAMAADCRHPLLGDISPIRLRKVEAASEPRLPEPGKCAVVVLHRRVYYHISRLRAILRL